MSVYPFRIPSATCSIDAWAAKGVILQLMLTEEVDILLIMSFLGFMRRYKISVCLCSYQDF
jgi:hypothetical protein